MARTAGTLVGVAIAAVVAATGNSVALLIVLSCIMAAAVPWASRRSHALTVIAFTPIVFVFLSVLGPDQYLFVPRIVDTAVGAAIVLVMDLAFWSTAPSLRPEAQLGRSREAVAGCSIPRPARSRSILRSRAFAGSAQLRSVSQGSSPGGPTRSLVSPPSAFGTIDPGAVLG